MNAFKNDMYVQIFLDLMVGVTRRITSYNKNIKLIPVVSDGHSTSRSLDLLSEGLYADIIQDIKDVKSLVLKNNIAGVNDASTADFIYVCASHVDELIIKKLDTTMSVNFRGMAERVLFGSVIAGENIFNKIELLISKKSQSDLAMAPIYYLIISFGFKGKYLARDDHSDLAILADSLKSIAFDESRHSLPWVDPMFISDNADLFVYRRLRIFHILLLSLLCISFLMAIVVVDYNWSDYFGHAFDQV